MAKNVVVNGTTYGNVAFVKLLQTNGSFATFLDSDTITSGREIHYAEGEITPSESVAYLDFTDFAFTPRVFIIAAVSPSTALATNGVGVVGDYVGYIRSASDGSPNTGFTHVGNLLNGSTGLNKFFSCSTVENITGNSAGYVYRTATSIRVCKCTGSPSFPFVGGQLYKWMAVGWED